MVSSSSLLCLLIWKISLFNYKTSESFYHAKKSLFNRSKYIQKWSFKLHRVLRGSWIFSSPSNYMSMQSKIPDSWTICLQKKKIYISMQSFLQTFLSRHYIFFSLLIHTHLAALNYLSLTKTETYNILFCFLSNESIDANIMTDSFLLIMRIILRVCVALQRSKIFWFEYNRSFRAVNTSNNTKNRSSI